MSWCTRSIKHRQGLWPLNGHADDMSGYGNHGTLVNAPTWAANQFGRQCIELDGVDQYVNLGDLIYLNAVSAFTIAFWMNQDVLDQTDVVFRKYLDGDNNITIFTSDVDGTLRVEIENGGLGRAIFDYSTVISANSWHHVAVVFDGVQTGNANRLIVYVDGKPVTLTFAGTIQAVTSDLSGQDTTIGRVTASFDGKLFDFNINSAPLSRDEINALMRGHG